MSQGIKYAYSLEPATLRVLLKISFMNLKRTKRKQINEKINLKMEKTEQAERKEYLHASIKQDSCSFPSLDMIKYNSKRDMEDDPWQWFDSTNTSNVEFDA